MGLLLSQIRRDSRWNAALKKKNTTGIQTLPRSYVYRWGGDFPILSHTLFTRRHSLVRFGKAAQRLSHPSPPAYAGDYHVNHCEGCMEVAAGF